MLVEVKETVQMSFLADFVFILTSKMSTKTKVSLFRLILAFLTDFLENVLEFSGSRQSPINQSINFGHVTLYPTLGSTRRS